MSSDSSQLNMSVLAIISGAEKMVNRVEEISEEGVSIFPSDYEALKKSYNLVHNNQLSLYYELCSIISNLGNSLIRIKLISSQLTSRNEFISPQTKNKLSSAIEIISLARQSAIDLKYAFDARLRFMNSLSYDPTVKQYV